MDKEARVAFVIAQAAMLNAEIAAMNAANQMREMQGQAVAYGEEEFQGVLNKYSHLGYNELECFFAG